MNFQHLSILWSICICTALALLISTHVNAEERLTPEHIQNWLNSQSALESWGDKHEEALSKYEPADSDHSFPELDAQSMIEPIKASGLYEQANTLIQSFNFQNLEHWAQTTLRITKAVAAIELAQQPELTDMSELKQLLDNPSINKDQKAQIAEMIDRNQKIIEQLFQGTSEADIAAVKPLLPQIVKQMEGTE